MANTDGAKRAALRLLERTGLGSANLPIDPFAICGELGIQVKAKNMPGLDGALLRVGARGKILYGEHMSEQGRVHFTVSHELGHWEMHPRLQQLWVCTAEDVGGYRGSDEEMEANTFAAELLMPTPKLKEVLRYASPTFSKSAEIAKTCGTSLTAAALRLVELTDQAALAVMSANNRTLWVVKNHKARSLYLERGAPVDAESLAWNCLDSPDCVGPPAQVPAEAWFPQVREIERLEVYEQSAVLGSYNLTLTILTVDES